jgi:hypothetical protein
VKRPVIGVHHRTAPEWRRPDIFCYPNKYFTSKSICDFFNGQKKYFWASPLRFGSAFRLPDVSRPATHIQSVPDFLKINAGSNGKLCFGFSVSHLLAGV